MTSRKVRIRARVLKVAARHPVEAVHRLTGQLELRNVESERLAARGAYSANPEWFRTLHAHLGAPICEEEEEFRAIWEDIEKSSRGLQVQSHDGDAALARAVWCAIRHSSASRAVETGVARGVSSRIVLEALRGRPDSHLWSVDLPLLSEAWAGVLGAAVPEVIRCNWTYVRGPTRRVLPRLLRQVGPIDVFLQDSRSTLATAGFEFQAAWKALRPGGVLVANSIDQSLAFARFIDDESPNSAIVAPFERKSGLFGLACKA